MATILIIDDDPLVRTTLRAMLQGAGHEVLEAEDGDDGLALFDAHRPALVITDIIMPRREGIEIILTLRRTAPAVRIIGISGGGAKDHDNSGTEYLDMARKLGADRVLSKPFSAKELLSTVTELVAGSGPAGLDAQVRTPKDGRA